MLCYSDKKHTTLSSYFLHQLSSETIKLQFAARSDSSLVLSSYHWGAWGPSAPIPWSVKCTRKISALKKNPSVVSNSSYMQYLLKVERSQAV